MSKNFLDCPQFQNVAVYALLRGGKLVGKIIAGYRQSSLGRTCRVSVLVDNPATTLPCSGPVDFSVVGKVNHGSFDDALRKCLDLNGIPYEETRDIDSGRFEKWFLDRGIVCEKLL